MGFRALGGFMVILYLAFMFYIIYLFHTLAMSNKRMAEALERIMEDISRKAGE
jgi:archaellum component FlaF (FlaF/FlaG flagellin family)